MVGWGDVVVLCLGFWILSLFEIWRYCGWGNVVVGWKWGGGCGGVGLVGFGVFFCFRI